MNNPPTATSAHTTRRGAAFIVALMVVSLVALVALVFARQMHSEALAASNYVAATQARWSARGAVEAVRGRIAEEIATGNPPGISDLGVEAEPLAGGYYWLIRPGYDDVQQDFGLIHEAGKININSAEADVLVELPGVTPEIADAIVDWRDADEEQSDAGAESEYYLGLDQPYHAKNAPLESLGELLLIRGIDAAILHGEDRNRNGVLDRNEDDGLALEPSDDGDGGLDRGLEGLCTVYSREPNVDSTGEDRVYLNDPSDALSQLLQDVLSSERFGQVIALVDDNRPYASTLDFYIKTRLTEAEFGLLHDRITVSQADAQAGLIDVYTAPASVFDAMAELDPGDGQAIVAARPILEPGQSPGPPVWLVGALGEEKAVAASARLTDRSYQFTADIVAVTGDGRGFCRWRVVLDAGTPFEDGAARPSIVNVQDLSTLGWPLDEAHLVSLRAGAPLQHSNGRSMRSGLNLGGGTY